MTETIHSRTPIRIDLSGGTVDIWPIYLYINSAMTINMGIDLYAESWITTSGRKDSKTEVKITLISEDQNTNFECTLADLPGALIPGSLELHRKIFIHFIEERSLNQRGFPENISIKTKARSPAGAGLGGSSALSIALIGALDRWAHADREPDLERLIRIARDIESKILGVPAGLQDYYGATYGGLQRISWKVDQPVRHGYSEDLATELEKRIILFYSGKSRNSGINNWNVFKQFIDGNTVTVQALKGIAQATTGLDENIKNSDWKKVGQSISKEWTARQNLDPGISTSEIDQCFQKSVNLGATGGKICGAGGGGCFFIYLPSDSKEDRQQIIDEIADEEIRHLDYRIDLNGLTIDVEHG